MSRAEKSAFYREQIGVHMTSKSIYYIVTTLFLICASGPFSKAQNIYQVSTYDDPQYAKQGERRHQQIEYHQASLSRLDESKLFDSVQIRLIPKLTARHQSYFKSHNEYRLLFFTSGNLFGSSCADTVFIVYDRQNARISILLYDGSTVHYGELFRDIKVENGLASAKCNYFAFGTLDYQVGGEILYMKDGLTKKPDTFFDLKFCKCADISTDADLAHLGGCFAKGFNKNNVNGFTSLCIAKSFVYNSWECLKYDRNRNIFIIFYGQAYAD